MMKKTAIVVAVIMVMLLFGNLTKAGVSVIVNGTFEKDGRISNITEENTPHGWPDVNLPENKFVAWVKSGWSTYVEGGYSLTVYSTGWEVPSQPVFAVDDRAVVSQWVYLEDVNEIIFDLKLTTNYGPASWDPTKRSAILLIDDAEVWSSDSLSPVGSGEYLNTAVDVNGLYGAGLHKLSLGIKSNVEGTAFYQFLTLWDFVRFDTHCEGFGYLRADLNYDCYVDWPDLELLVEQWLEEPSAERYDLFVDDENIIDLYDFSVLAESWLDNSFWQPDKLLDMDMNNDGIVNFSDFAFLAEDWELESVDYDDINKLAEQWLETNWIYELW
jgi:hypothetical protein